MAGDRDETMLVIVLDPGDGRRGDEAGALFPRACVLARREAVRESASESERRERLVHHSDSPRQKTAATNRAESGTPLAVHDSRM